MTLFQPLARRLPIFLIAIIVLISFRTFAAFRSPILNSDHAIHILMAYHLRLPEDLYFWGQDRLGSVVPLLSHWLLQISPLRPVEAVSWVQYALLLIGFLCLSSLFKRPASRVIFALVWFLPLNPFSTLVAIAQPYGPQFTFVGLALVGFNLLINRSEQLQGLKRQIVITAVTACLWLSLWVSDLSVVILALLLLGGAWVLFQQIRRNIQQSKPVFADFRYPDLLNTLITSSAGIWFIHYAKEHATRKIGRYSSLNTPSQVFEILERMGSAFTKTLLFQLQEPFLSFHAVLALGLVAYLGYLLISKKYLLGAPLSRWFYLFLASAILGFFLLGLSNWVYRNPDLRYYTFVYVAWWMALLLFAETLQSSAARKIYFLLILIALSASLSLPGFTYKIPANKSRIEKLAPLQSMEPAGFIGEYWSSYVICSADPARFNCTSYDQKGVTPCPSPTQPRPKVGSVRCKRCVREVLASDTIYLVKERWFEQFPGEIQQFGQCLVKNGEERKLGWLKIAPYQKRTVDKV